ncbi:MAG: protein kinase [Cyclobacteriaceae bacterium]
MKELEPHVFLSYSHKDSAIKHVLFSNFSNKYNGYEINTVDGQVYIWADNTIQPGEVWNESIKSALKAAKCAILLISQNFRDSSYIMKHEFPEIMGRCKKGTLRVLWISVDPAIDDTILDEINKIQSVIPPQQTLRNLLEDPKEDLGSVAARLRGEILRGVYPTIYSLEENLAKHQKYELQERIGEGQNAIVYRAFDRDLERNVGIRVLKNSEMKKSFQDVLKNATEIGGHNTIITVYGAWLKTKPYYSVIQFIKGPTLRQRFEKTAGLSTNQVVEILLRIGKAVQHAHRNKFFHQNIKPSNILLEEEELTPYLSPFSRQENMNGSALLKKYGRKMSPEERAYLVPEHFRFDHDDKDRHKSDQYLIGLLGYEMLTNTLPRTIKSIKDLQERGFPAFIPLPDIRKKRKDIPATLADTIMKMVQLHPEDRYDSMDEVLAHLRGYNTINDIRIGLAKDSFVRCMANDNYTKFFSDFYENFFKYRNEAKQKFEQKGNWDEIKKRHFRAIKQAIIDLFAYAENSRNPRNDDKYNVLTDTAYQHKGLGLKEEDYKFFQISLIETICQHDDHCRVSEEAKSIIERAWKTVFDPGVEYMIRNS